MTKSMAVDVPGVPGRMGGSLRGFVAAILLAVTAAAPAAAADLFLSGEPEVYDAIDKLDAMGYFPGLLTGKRPYTVSAIRSAVRSAANAPAADPFGKELLRWLSDYTAPRASGHASTAASWSDDRFVPPNNDGLPVPRGFAGHASVFAREESSPNLSAQVRTASFLGEGGDEGTRLLDTSLETGTGDASLVIGNISTWYGPGRHGALILTNNAEPYPGVRIHNPEPIRPGGLFSFLGAFQYDFFIAQMEQKPKRSRSKLVGTRLAVRPASWIELGTTRVLHYGGAGRSDGPSEFFATYFGSNDPPDRSNTLAGFDLKLTLPSRFQPFQFYWDRTGEGEHRVHGTNIPWPGQWANLVGLYFPKVLGSSRLDLRGEYADNYGGRAKSAQWYRHGAYDHLYRGQPLGHHMDGDSRDLFIEARYLFSPDSYASLAYDYTRHEKGVGGDIVPPGERRHVYGAGLTGWISPSWRAEARASLEQVRTRGGVPGATETGFSGWLGVTYRVASARVPGRRGR